jgi:hypothetical protein
MTTLSKPKIVLLGMMTKMPVAGNVWLVAQYLLGFQRLGYDAYYVEAHGVRPGGILCPEPGDDDFDKAAAFVDRVMRRFDLGDHWAYHARYAGERVYGMTERKLKELYGSADLIINLHGGTIPMPEHSRTGRLVYLGTDPVELEIELYDNRQETIDFLNQHAAYFTWGLNYGHADSKVPVSPQFDLKPNCPPVIVDLWQSRHIPPGEAFTTIGNWRQATRTLTFQGETYTWSKHHEYLKFIDLPRRTTQPFELALASYQEEDKSLLTEHGWRVRHALDFSTDLDGYRDYIRGSRGEFTVAKDQNVRLRSGWFSERSAQYLAAGRPVITQETGFSNVLPTGRGLFAFSTMEDILTAVDSINSNYEAHSRAATELAREYFHFDVVLKPILKAFGL